MHKGGNLALKAKVEENVEERREEEFVEWSPKETKYDYHEHMALASKAFWKNNDKNSKSRDNPRSNSSGPRFGSPRLRTCYNCGDKNHFGAECPFENREKNGGKLVRKYKSKTSFKKNFFNKKLVNKNSTNKNPPRYVLVTQEEYSSGDEEEDESPSEVAGVAALATTSTPSTSLFMAKATEVSSPSTSIPNPSKPMLSDLGSLKGKEEVVALDEFISNLQGETKRHFETLMGQLGQAQDFIEEK
jgi:hypothetical protein